MLDRHVLSATLHDQLASLRASRPAARVRLLSGADIDGLVDALVQAEKLARPGDVRLTGKLIGGFVPNAYGSVGSADRVDVTVDLATGAVVTLVRRAAAEIRAHGRGNPRVVRLVREGRSDGRVLSL